MKEAAAVCSLHGIRGCGSCFADTRKEERTRYTPPHLRGAAGANSEERRTLESLSAKAASGGREALQQGSKGGAKQDVSKMLQKSWNCKKTDLVAFAEEEDPYNTGVRLSGYLCTKTNHSYDNMCVTAVNGRQFEQPLFLYGQVSWPTTPSVFIKEMAARSATHCLLQRNPGGILVTVFAYVDDQNQLRRSVRVPCKAFYDHEAIRHIFHDLGSPSGVSAESVTVASVEVWCLSGPGMPSPVATSCGAVKSQLMYTRRGASNFSVPHTERTVRMQDASRALIECVDESTHANDAFRRSNRVEPPPLPYPLKHWKEHHNWSGVVGALCDAGWFAYASKDGSIVDGGIRSAMVALWAVPRSMNPVGVPVADILKRSSQPAPPTSVAPPRMLLLVGLPGSGKSTLAKRLTGWTRINQDDEGSRQACESKFAKVSQNPKTRVVLDRCNISVDQRKVWLDLAREKGWTVDCIVFDWSADECIQRCVAREGHPTIEQHNLEKASSIVHTMAHSMHAPRPFEGLTKIHVVSSFDDVDAMVAQYSVLQPGNPSPNIKDSEESE